MAKDYNKMSYRALKASFNTIDDRIEQAERDLEHAQKVQQQCEKVVKDLVKERDKILKAMASDNTEATPSKDDEKGDEKPEKSTATKSSDKENKLTRSRSSKNTPQAHTEPQDTPQEPTQSTAPQNTLETAPQTTQNTQSFMSFNQNQ